MEGSVRVTRALQLNGSCAYTETIIQEFENGPCYNVAECTCATGLNNAIANGTWSPKAPNTPVAVNTTEWMPPRDFRRHFGARLDLSF